MIFVFDLLCYSLKKGEFVMKSKKQIIGLVITIISAILLIVSCFVLPQVKVIVNNFAGQVGAVPEVNGNFKMFEFLNQNIMDVMWNAGKRWYAGPFWLVSAGIAFNCITLIGCLIVVVLAVIGIVGYVKNKTFFNKNGAIKHVGIATAVVGLLVSVAGILGFIGLNASAFGYMKAYALVGLYVNAVLCVLLIVGSSLTQTREEVRKNKIKSCVVYAVIFALSLFVGVIIFSPYLQIDGKPLNDAIIFNEQFSAELSYEGSLNLSGPVSTLLGIANSLVIVCSDFLMIYSLIGFILSVCNKNTNWLDGKMKSWGRTLLIFAIAFACLVFSALIILTGQLYAKNDNFALSWNIWAVLISGFLIFITAYLLPYNKKIKAKKLVNLNSKN